MMKIMSEDLIQSLVPMARSRRDYDKNVHLFHQGDRITSLYVMESGIVELVRHDTDGRRLVIHRAWYEAIIAEASVYADAYHCDAIAVSPSSLFEVPLADFHHRLKHHAPFASLWAAYLARQVQLARYRAELLTRKTIAGRLEGWLAWPKKELPPKGYWKNLAGELGVSPEALYRELAKRRS
jgi:CRP-like cAMP-binding protein